ncbi:MAG: transcriptional regulator [Pseudomonadota bacterium]
MTGDPAPFDYSGLDRVIHEKARLGIMTSLVGQRDGLSFSQLKQVCALTDGNLSRHLSVLEEAGLVLIEKSHRGKRPHTSVVLTADGERQFLAYVEELERVVRDAAARAKPQRTSTRALKPG